MTGVASVSDVLRVEVAAAPVVLCVSCKKRLGVLKGEFERFDIEQIQFSVQVGVTCPYCGRHWSVVDAGQLKIKTDRGLLP